MDLDMDSLLLGIHILYRLDGDILSGQSGHDQGVLLLLHVDQLLHCGMLRD